jgi:hypothetical protein
MPRNRKCPDCRRKAVVGLNGVWYCNLCFDLRLLEIRSMIDFILELKYLPSARKLERL